MNTNIEQEKSTVKTRLDTIIEDTKSANPGPENITLSEKEVHVVRVQFSPASDMFYYETSNLTVKKSDAIIVNTEDGTALGHIIEGPYIKSQEETFPDGKIQKIIRIANDKDIDEDKKAKLKEPEAFNYCLERIKALNLDMKLVKVKFYFGCKKVIFYFTADDRVDFRQLVKDLVTKYKIRIELRQIGVRDETKIIGAVGICGQELCCANFSRKFPSVSIKMAKDQNLSLNPAKISGQCGRLLCCLCYEHQAYKDLGENLPKLGKKCKFKGQACRVMNVNLLRSKITLQMEDESISTVNINDFKDAQGSLDVDEYSLIANLIEEFSDLDLLPFITSITPKQNTTNE